MTKEELIDFRRYLHRHPELSGREYGTRDAIIAHLPQGQAERKIVGETGISLHFRGAKEGPKILIRADIDALPIEEINHFPHRSAVKGVSHKCGHDGHATILLGLAHHLHSRQSVQQGEVMLVFQPAEENGEGARAILEDKNFNFHPDWVFALHNLPAFPLHQVVCRTGIFTAAARSIIFRFEGKTSHAAEPEMGINPAMAMADLIRECQSLNRPDISAPDFRLISIIHMTLGEKAYGISAGEGEVHLTLRSWENGVMEELSQELQSAAGSLAEKHSLKLQTELLQEFQANENDVQAFELIKQTAKELQLDFLEKAAPFKWGEDFGLFSSRYKGAMFGIGAGEESPALHNPDYDFPDELIESGINMFSGLIDKILLERY